MQLEILPLNARLLFVKYEPRLVGAARRAVFGRDRTHVNVAADQTLPVTNRGQDYA
jgi:hypothetical protein